MSRYSDDSVRAAIEGADLPAIAARFTRLQNTGRKYQALCPFHREKTPSFGLYPAKSGRGWRWRCLGACNEGGDAAAFVMKAEGVGFREAMERLGAPPVVTEEDRRRIAAQEKRNRDAALKDLGHKVEAARKLWRDAVPIAGTAAEIYLHSRGLVGPWPETLRFVPELKHADDGRTFPAMLAVMTSFDGQFRGVHRTYLAADGSAKAPVTRGAAKKMLGASDGATIRLDPPAGDMVMGEGIESALSVRQETGRPALACMALFNFGAPLPRAVRRVTLCFDSDEKDLGQAEIAKMRGARAQAERGLAVLTARPPPGFDFNDLLRRGAP